MEIELEFEGSGVWLAVMAAVIVALVALGALGRAVTPNPPHVLTWRDWRFMAVQREYDRELAALREDGQTLAALVDGQPTIETAWKAEEILKRVQGDEGLPVLTGRRAAVADAAQAIMDWVSGVGSRENAVEAVNNALERLRDE